MLLIKKHNLTLAFDTTSLRVFIDETKHYNKAFIVSISPALCSKYNRWMTIIRKTHKNR